jgi:hypothetical protein
VSLSPTVPSNTRAVHNSHHFVLIHFTLPLLMLHLYPNVCSHHEKLNVTSEELPCLWLTQSDKMATNNRICCQCKTPIWCDQLITLQQQKFKITSLSTNGMEVYLYVNTHCYWKHKIHKMIEGQSHCIRTISLHKDSLTA